MSAARSAAQTDLLIVGSGVMGSLVAAMVREQAPGVRVTMIDAGHPIGSVPGQHLHDSVEPEVREAYLHRAAPGIQSLYLGAETTPSLGGTVAGARPGMYNVSAFGSDAQDMPAAAVGWNAGGMAVHWAAATPTPWGEERFGVETWDADLAEAARLLRVHRDPFGPTAVSERVLPVLRGLFAGVSAPGREPGPMPMAIPAGTDEVVAGPLPRTGPNAILPRMLEPAGEDFELLTGLTVTRVLHAGGRARAVVVRDSETGQEREIAAGQILLAADTMRTPQLLHASGIRPPALGTNLNEHAFLTGQVIADPQRLGLKLDDVPRPRDGETMLGSYWLPHSGAAQPFHGQFMDRLNVDENGDRLAYSIGMTIYVPTGIRQENRLEFDENTLDAAGLPRIAVRFGLDQADLERLETARGVQARVAGAFGDFDPATDSALLAPGSSLHWTGTTRSGTADDGSSVCAPDGRVWGFDNLYLAGGSVVPTAIVGNSTLAAAVTAVRAARSLTGQLFQSGPGSAARSS